MTNKIKFLFSSYNKIKDFVNRILNFLNIRSYVLIYYIKILKYTPWRIKSYLKMKSFFRQFINRGDLVFDVGADGGRFTLNFFNIGAKVISIEPQRKMLKRLYEKFSKSKKIIIKGKALGEKKGTGTIYICDEADGIATLSDKWRNKGRFSKKYEWNKTKQIRISTLDQLINQYGLPKFCKIDVEGYEFNVLKGLTKKIPIISIEFTKEFLNDTEKCLNYLRGLGNLKLNYIVGEDFSFKLPKWTPQKKFLEILNQEQDDLAWGDIYIKIQ